MLLNLNPKSPPASGQAKRQITHTKNPVLGKPVLILIVILQLMFFSFNSPSNFFTIN